MRMVELLRGHIVRFNRLSFRNPIRSGVLRLQKECGAFHSNTRRDGSLRLLSGELGPDAIRNQGPMGSYLPKNQYAYESKIHYPKKARIQGPQT
ncbi:hypothetical protein VTK26DRAFT_8777 [Humicola hyalothermophila]